MIITATRGLPLVLSGHFSDEDRVLFGHQKKTERITFQFLQSFFTQNRKCQPHGGTRRKARGIAKAIRIHSLGTRN